MSKGESFKRRLLKALNNGVAELYGSPRHKPKEANRKKRISTIADLERMRKRYSEPEKLALIDALIAQKRLKDD